MNQHNYCFFYGDLNYRLNHNRTEVLKWIEENNIEELQKHAGNHVFTGWTEIPPTFRPTYKYEREILDNKGSRIYSQEKLRVPSWCDRILWKSHPSYTVERLEYKCCNSILTSDHSPVWASYTIPVRLPSSSLAAPLHKTQTLCSIQFTDVSVKATFQNPGEKNIYINFVAPFLEGKCKTPIAKKTATPHWDTIPSFPLKVFEKEYIQSHELILVVMDQQIGSDINYGQAVVSLKDACGDLPSPFAVTIYKGGAEYGEIEGNIHVTGLISVRECLELFLKTKMKV